MAKPTVVSVTPRTIDQWTKGFATLYAKPDSYRQPEEFWNATMAHLSIIGESIRRTHYNDLMRAAAHSFCWMCCYINNCNKTNDKIFKIDHNLSEIIGFKFPNVCGHCKGNPCTCDPIKTDAEGDKSSEYEKLLNRWDPLKSSIKDFTIQMWLEQFRTIYGGRIHLLALENIGFHLLEEAGEEAMAVRQLVQFRGITQKGIPGIDDAFLNKIAKIPGLVHEYADTMKTLKTKYNTNSDKVVKEKLKSTDKSSEAIKIRLLKGKMDCVIEVADTFSWFCAVLLKLDEIVKNMALPGELNKTYDIERAIIGRYKSPNPAAALSCYACNETQCKCIFYPEKKKKK